MATTTVKELIAQHAASIGQLKQDNADYAGKDIGVPFDDLFVLRYLLSAKGDTKVAGKKLRETLEWRSSNLDKLNRNGSGDVQYKREYNQFVKTGVVGWLGEHDLVFLVRTGLGDLNGVLTALTEDQVLDFFIMHNEYLFRLVDARTRETGVLCKMITVVDLNGFAMSRFNRKFSAIFGKSSHASNVYFPQLLRCTVFLNLPTMLRMLLKTVNMVLPKETVEKQRVCPGRVGKQSPAECPFLRSKLNGNGEAVVALMPPFLGGTGSVVDGLKHESDQV